MSATGVSPREIENLGVLFAGFVITTVLYGLTFFQTFAYYARFPQDNHRIQYFVISLVIVDTAISALVSAVLYHFLIDMFDVSVEVLYAPTTLCMQYALSPLLIFMSQLFFAHRAMQVTGGSKLLALVPVSLSFVAFVFGITSAGQMFLQRQMSDLSLPSTKAIAMISLGFATMADFVILVTLYYWLRQKHHPALSIPKRSLDRVGLLFVNRGMCFTIVQLAYFCIFTAFSSRQYWVAFQMAGCKCYVNSVLALLNYRKSRNGKGLNEEESLPPRSMPKEPGTIPAAVRIVDRSTGVVWSESSSEPSQGLDTTGATESTTDSHKIVPEDVIVTDQYQQVATGLSGDYPRGDLDSIDLPVPV
ncbi:hypothetical protein V8B97DRAFT_1944804 [Scleroderma yunnanense]